MLCRTPLVQARGQYHFGSAFLNKQLMMIFHWIGISLHWNEITYICVLVSEWKCLWKKWRRLLNFINMTQSTSNRCHFLFCFFFFVLICANIKIDRFFKLIWYVVVHSINFFFVNLNKIDEISLILLLKSINRLKRIHFFRFVVISV